MPKILSGEQESVLIKTIESQCKARPDLNKDFSFSYSKNLLSIVEGNKVSVFDLRNLSIEGEVSPAAISVKDQLRRNGIRFKYEEVNGFWKSWKS